ELKRRRRAFSVLSFVAIGFVTGRYQWPVNRAFSIFMSTASARTYPRVQLPRAASGPMLDPMARRSSLPGFEDLPLLLQAEEVAAILRVSRKALYAMVERGEIPGVTKLGRRVRFRRDALEAWLIASARP
ncbi:MAG TPA: helix-turn-helix domain-containing protein, partial [Enhygromyxa sp.]|nr:helix-turn-helix domain-containing protein [Enhygromyxa sp.]